MIGKLRALQRSTTPAGHFTVLALDHADALRRALRPNAPQSVTDAEMTAFKLDAAELLQDQASAVLLDPVHGAAQAVAANLLGRCGLLVELEKADYQFQPLPLDFEIRPGWSVSQIKRMGGDGVKLFYYYHPEQKEHAERQNRRLAEVVAASAAEDVPLYLEPILYSVMDPSALPRLVRQSAMDAVAVGADILKLEFPASPEDRARWQAACESITEAVNRPWTLLSAGVDFDTYCLQVETACRAGASGYIAGRAVWGDACAIADRDQRRAWLASEGKARLERLNMITTRTAASFRSRWASLPVGTDWFTTYSDGARP
jgi:tagatose 1,6-diphosphate aldolase